MTITGTATEDQTLTANTSTLADADGLGTVSYKWQRAATADGTYSDITDATAATYVLGDADVGKFVRVVASYTDLQGTAESVASAATAAVVNVNDLPTLTVVSPTLNLNSGEAITGITVNDTDSGDILTVRLSVLAGTIGATVGSTGATIDGNNSATVTITDTLADVNSILANLIYTQTGSTNDDVLFIEVKDAADTTYDAFGSIELIVGGADGTVVTSYDLSGAQSVAYASIVDPVVITDSSAADVVVAVTGSDLVISKSGGAGSLTLTGHTGDLDGSKLQFADGSTLLRNAAGDAATTLLGTQLVDQLIAGNLGDTLRGYAGADKLVGGDGADKLYGGADADILLGGAGADRLYGEAGADVVTGGAGNDLIYGSADGAVGSADGAVDKFVYLTGDNGADIILQFENGQDKIVLSGADLSGGLGTYATVTAIGSDTLITLGNGYAGTIRLVGVASNLIDASDFASS